MGNAPKLTVHQDRSLIAPNELSNEQKEYMFPDHSTAKIDLDEYFKSRIYVPNNHGLKPHYL